MTMQPSRDIDAARRRAERIRIKARSITEQYSDLRALVDEAERCEDHLTLGYPSWTAYVADLFGDEPLRLPRDSRIPMSNMLAEKGMSNRAIGVVLGVDEGTVRNDRAAAEYSAPVPESAEPERIDRTPDREPYPQARRAPWPERRDDPEPERIDRLTGEVVPAPTFKPLDVTDWTPEELDAQIAADDAVIESYERATVPAPVKVVGLDGKTYTRPEPKAAETRDYTPEPKRGTDAHALRYVVIPTLSAWSDLWADKALLDNTVDAEEAAQILRDLSKLTPVLSQIRRLLTSRTESIK